MVFSDTITNSGIVEQVRDICRVDVLQWPTQKIANSVNNYLDTIAGYALNTDRIFAWDDTNHTKLPIGTTNLVANQSDYSFLTDEQGNPIVTLTRIDIKDSSGNWTNLQLITEADISGAIDAYQATAGQPTQYVKLADNIVRLFPKPATSVTAGLKFYFQRTPNYFVATDTTKSPGVNNLLHRGFVVASAYDCALTLGLQNLQPLSVEFSKEQQKMIAYFSDRNNDSVSAMRPAYQDNR